MNERRHRTAWDALDIVERYIGVLSIKQQHSGADVASASHNASRLLRENRLPKSIREKLYKVADVAANNYEQAINAIQDVENEKKAIVQACVFCVLYIVVFCVAVALCEWRFLAGELVVAFVDYRYTGNSSIVRFLSSLPDAFSR